MSQQSQKQSANDAPYDDEGDDGFYFSSEDDDMGAQVEGINLDDKDSDEEELERLVLGDGAGFRQQLFKDGFAGQGGSDEEGALEATGPEDLDDSALFYIDGDKAGADASGQLVKADLPTAVITTAGHLPAWDDSDDERLSISLAGVARLRKLRVSEAEDVVSGVEYTKRLRQQFLRLNPLPEWARSAERQKPKRRRRSSAASSESDASVSEASDDEGSERSALPLEKLLRSSALLNGDGQRKRRKLRPEVIDIQRTRDIPDVHKGPVETISFHPQYPILLSCSTSSILHLHHIAPTAHPTPNPSLTSVQVKNTPIRRSEFLYPDGNEIIFAGRRRFFHTWNISTGQVRKVSKILGHRLEHKSMERFRLSPCGRYMALIATSRKGGGMVNILNVKTMQWLSQARLDSRGGIADFAWWSTSDGLTILGRDGQVAEWSMEIQRTVGLWRDEGSTGGTVIAMGGRNGPASLGEDRWVAVGSNSGVLNIYDRLTLLTPDKEVKALPEPTRRCEQLTTPITLVAFAPDSQLLAFGSIHKKDALRLVHLPSCTVYRNWPTDQTPLGRVTAIAFGRQSDILCVGNDSGKMRLWEIRN